MVNTGIKMTNIGEYLKVFIIDVEKEEVLVQDMPNTLKDMKRITHSNCIEIGDVTIRGQAFKMIYSSKVNDNQHISCVDENGTVNYRGNIIVVGCEVDVYGGETLASLVDDDINLLLGNTGLMFIENKDGGSYNTYVLCNVIDMNNKE